MSADSQLRFVLHEHHRPRHHFDLRLEEGGVLRSWAVPRGLPDSPRDDRLAVAVGDHDIDHLSYEDADKSIADHGTWEEHDRNDRRLVFTLHGQNRARRYALIHTGKDWLLHLTKDQPTSAPCPPAAGSDSRRSGCCP
jgi:DNA ligase D-like protein (predicted 3'-phosphoesterase)